VRQYAGAPVECGVSNTKRERRHNLGKGRLEAFTDGVIAIIITIMVLEIKAPAGADFATLSASAPVFLAYVLSFANVAIFWNNHHHMLHATERINGTVLWANMFFLFWLSLVPFVIRWVDEVGLAALPVAAYGAVLAMAAIGYTLVQEAIVACNGGRDSALAKAIGHDVKGKLSLGTYVAAVPLAFISAWFAILLYVAVALMWLVPDRRIEATIEP
jgi:uncharacterized membrane protein